MEVRSDRVYRFPVSRAELWQSITSIEDYPRWWPRLRRFEATALAPGEIWRCALQPWWGVALRGDVQLVEVVVLERIVAELTGDLVGSARIELWGDGPETEVRVVSALVAVRLPMRVFARLAPSLARRGHDWVVDYGARQFAEAIGATAPSLRQ